ncbi:ribonuclease H-like domain-containing protein [Tanacetum coccineum]
MPRGNARTILLVVNQGNTPPVMRYSLGMFLSQRKYATEIHERAHMVCFNLCRTPVEPECKLGADGDPVSDLTYAVKHVCLYIMIRGSLISRLLSGFCVIAEVEYRGVANVGAESCWLRNLLRKLHIPLAFPTLVIVILWEAAGDKVGNGERERRCLDVLEESIEDEEVSLVDGVLEGALGALGDES